MIEDNERASPHILYGAIEFMVLYAVVEAGVLELLSKGPKTIQELAETKKLDADILLSCLVILSDPNAKNICIRNGDTFALGEQGTHYLRGGSEYAGIIMYGSPSIWRSIGEFPNTLKTGTPAFNGIHEGATRFEWLHRPGNEEPLKNFLQRMKDISALEEPAILDAYDFSAVSNVLDIGSGSGDLIMSILTKHPEVQGGMFDLPKVINSVRPLIADGIKERCTLVEGDFFSSLPTGYDLLICKRITHDWTFGKALQLLQNCYKHMPVNGKLLLMERAHGEGIDSHLSMLYMSIVTGGTERSQQKLNMLLNEAGFAALRTIPTNSQIVIIEGEKKS